MTACRYEMPPDVGPDAESPEPPTPPREPPTPEEICADDEVVASPLLVEHLRAAVGSSGDAIATWWIRRSPWLATRRAGGAFGADRLLGTLDHQRLQGPRVTIGPGGAAWLLMLDGRAVITFHRPDRDSPLVEYPVLDDSAESPVADSMRLAVDAAGVATAVWASRQKGSDRIWAARFAAPHGDPVVAPVSAAALSTRSIATGTHASGDVVAAWDETSIAGDRIVFAEHDAGRSAWTEPLALAHSAGSPGVAAGGDGAVLVAWTAPSPTGGTLWARRRSAAGTWSDVEVVADGIAPGWTPAVAVDPAGRGEIAWHEQDGDTMILRAASWSPDGALTYLPTTGRAAKEPRFAVSAEGTIAAVWTECSAQKCRVMTGRSTAGGWDVQRASARTDYPEPMIAETAIAIEGAHQAVVWSVIRNVGMVICARRGSAWP